MKRLFTYENILLTIGVIMLLFGILVLGVTILT